METVFRARYVFPVDRPPIEDGVLSFSGGRIVNVQVSAGEKSSIDLGDVAIIPGLVNAHTHLEFSDLQKPLGAAGISLPWWIREVIAYRDKKSVDNDDAQSRHTGRVDPIQLGIDESARYGVTTVGNITNAVDIFYPSPLDQAQYLELRAARQVDLEGTFRDIAAFIDRRRLDQFFGVSPHAPYTVHQRLFSSVIALAAQTHTPLAMHLAETKEELQYLQTSRGPFRELLEERDQWEPGAIEVGSKPLHFLEGLARVPRSIVVHGNYLSDDETSFIAEHRDQMSVVYCPRTHAYFEHEAYRLWPMLQKGVRIALGTDSRASNPDLDLRKEMEFVIVNHGIPPEHALRLGTINGAVTMGLDAICGTLMEGKFANFAVVQLADRRSADPHELLFDPEARVVATICRGRVVFSEHPSIA